MHMSLDSTDTRRRLGAAGEQLAAEHLERRGFTILERNFRTRWGELDIVAFDGTTLVFCEVKSRRECGAGVDALASMHNRKRSQVRKLAGRWLVERAQRPRACELRFDAIGVTFDRLGRFVALEHLEGAF
jgi:putative endonuclease